MPVARLSAALEIAYDLRGAPTDPVVVLIAGLGDQLVFWDETFCAELVGAGLRVLRFANRDVGLSTKFDVGYTLEDMAEDVRLLLDELHIDSAHVVSTSMGG